MSFDLQNPPANVEAEKALLGALFVRNALMDDLPELISPESFAYGPNGLIYQACESLIKKGRTADPVTLREFFETQDALEEVGGAKYLMELAGSAVGRLNALEYAKVIKDLYLRRQIIDFGEELVERCYDSDPEKDAANDVDWLEKQVLSLLKEDERGELSEVDDAVDEAISEIEDKFKSETKTVGLSTGFHDLDKLIAGLEKGILTVVAGRPSMGKTALAVNIAQNITKAGKIAAVFSLEMTKKQLAYRLIANQSSISLTRLRDGDIGTVEWGGLMEATGALKNSLIRVDDSTSLTVSNIRTRARRLQKTIGLDLVVIDYLQLLQAESRYKGQRTLEISEITRELKNLAKELDIQVILLSQLSRAVEQRDNKRPLLSDLRESGCLSCETTLLTTPRGVQYNDNSRKLVSVLNKDSVVVMADSKNLVKRPSKLIRVALQTGRFIDCTMDHPILTDRGWVPAENITRDHAVALAAKIPEPPKATRISEARWIGWMLGNGSMLGLSSPSFICSDKLLANDFVRETERIFGLTPRPHHHHSAAVWQYDITAGPVRTSAGNPCKDWLRENDLWGRKSFDKYIPDWFMKSADNHSVAEILGGLIDTDGSVPLFTTQRSAVKFATSSKILAHQVLWCFLRLGIVAYIDENKKKKHEHHHTIFTVQVQDNPTLSRLRKTLRLTGEKGRKLEEMDCSAKGSNHGNRLGVWVSKRLIEISRQNGISQNALGYRDQKKRISQSDLSKFLGKIDAGKTNLDWLTSSSIWWDRLESITPMGIGEVFDREVDDDAHNFVANGIIVHNSIEQDADLVIFVYREEYYMDREEPPTKKTNETMDSFADRLSRFESHKAEVANVAELIVAKQRQGPTGTVKLHFDGAHVRFGDMWKQ